MRTFVISIFPVAITSLFVGGVFGCKDHTCLRWTATTTKLIFICKVDNLIFDVRILSPYSQEQAVCSPPYPSSQCKSHYENGIISQNGFTNETVLTLTRTIDTRVNGKWTCLHGKNRGQSAVDVSILLTKEDGWQQCSIWIIVPFVVIFSLWSFVFWCTDYMCDGSKVKKFTKCLLSILECICCKVKTRIIATKIMCTLVLFGFLLGIPFLIYQKEEQDCLVGFKIFQVMYGVLAASVLSFFVIDSIKRKGKKHNEQAQQPEAEHLEVHEVPT